MRSLLAALALLALAGACRAADTWALERWTPPFDYRGTPSEIAYQPLEKARKRWRICASYPHLKDSYWLSVNYGMVRHARKLGIALEIVEAGGYPNLDKQKAQIAGCAKSADALIVGAVSYDGLTPLLVTLSKRMPVIAAVNDIDSAGVVAKSGVSWISMGEAIGHYFAALHPKGSAKVRVAWFPGPKGAGWVGFVEEGFQRGIAGSSAEIVSVKWGDTGFEDQLLLLEDLLEQHPDVDYIIGSAVTADAAVSLLRAKNLTGRIGVLADYFTHGTYRAIKRGKVIAAPTDLPVVQGELAIDQAVRALEGTLAVSHAGPAIRIIDGNNINATDINDSLAPASFKPTFKVE
ncbi:MAG: TMAO reductase system periplasmic protein TorT [Aestuariivirga sp.]|uniref:TMAO reductase system periplasmic protein TorT n=1 Tax=Aestuariivirga sp. TaxID=2650926 RepID=UPI0025BD2B5E|nr:TMAO reductase system periplasmic protein TorT [Aestuariivirga sp.]MCA3560135.1 TMAO reductase system periplasmic protein TorT [Aestuariivirga sp.]